jgi:uncharacterized membrane protein YgcG
MLAVGLPARVAHAKFLMAADGPGGTPTYELLGRGFTIEVPDCGHMVPHITEVMDDELKKPVFVFHAHVNQDDDRCGATDRQRTEIRGGKLPEIVASNGQTVYYRWKFKLPAGFQSSASFTHIFQIKSDAASPVMTLTPRSGNLSIDGIVGVRGTTPLTKFIDTWVVVDLKLLFASAGHIDMTIRRLSDGEMLFSHSGAADTWQGNAAGHDSKYGIYRSLNNRASLRDEQVRFADFCISKTSAAECDDGSIGGGGTPTPTPDAGVTPEPEDAGAGGAAGEEPGSGGGGGQSTGGSGAGGGSGGGGDETGGSGGTPTTPPASHPDASVGPKVDAKPTTKPPGGDPEPTDDPADGQTAAAASSGCSVGSAGGQAGGAAIVLGLCAGALALSRRRRR